MGDSCVISRVLGSLCACVVMDRAWYGTYIDCILAWHSTWRIFWCLYVGFSQIYTS